MTPVGSASRSVVHAPAQPAGSPCRQLSPTKDLQRSRPGRGNKRRTSSDLCQEWSCYGRVYRGQSRGRSGADRGGGAGGGPGARERDARRGQQEPSRRERTAGAVGGASRVQREPGAGGAGKISG